MLSGLICWKVVCPSIGWSLVADVPVPDLVTPCPKVACLTLVEARWTATLCTTSVGRAALLPEHQSHRRFAPFSSEGKPACFLACVRVAGVHDAPTRCIVVLIFGILVRVGWCPIHVPCR